MSSKDNLSYGLNARNKRKKGLTSFGNDGSDDSNSDDDNNNNASTSAGPTTARSAINRDIAAEQAALRKRAKAAMSSSAMDSAVYDYDAEYDSFSSGKKKEDAARSAAAKTNAQKNEPKAKVQPRYITGLLQTAQRRNQEHEIIHERTVIKEQATEDANLQYEGKEKFITSSYKRKLAEREQWAKDEEELTKREEAEDVTKKKSGLGSFMFGGIGRSMLMGSGGDERKKAAGDDGEESNVKEREDMQQKVDDGAIGNDNHRDDYQHRESSRETERWGSSKRNRDSREEFSRPPPPSTSQLGDVTNAEKSTSEEQKKVKTRQQILEDRAIKIHEARGRYFKRRGVVTQ